MKNFINFIKYNNAFTFIVILLFIATTSIFAASPELRKDAIEAVISQEQKVLSLDNVKLLAQDFEKFDSKLQIKEIKEDNENYYVKYGFRTFAIRDYIWQEDDDEKILSVSKSFLADRDLGVYAAQELGEVVDYNLSYLKEAQEIEKKKGETNKVIAVEYGGLIGKFLDSKEKEFSDYQPVVEDKKTLVLSSENPSINATTNQIPPVITPQSAVAATVVIPDKEMVRQMVQEAIREILENKTSAMNSSSSISLEAVLLGSSSSSTASSSSASADTPYSSSSFPAESAGAASSASSKVSSFSSSSASSEMASSSSDSFSSTSASNSSLSAEANLSSEESNQSSSQESSSDSSELYSSEASSSSEPAQ